VTRDEIRAQVKAILLRLAPSLDLASLQPDASLRRRLAADSMDVLNFVIGLAEAMQVEVPEADYPKIDTLEGCVDYIAERLAGREQGGKHG
jgi:acyl carrier protein